jgi:hypothetical protein
MYRAGFQSVAAAANAAYFTIHTGANKEAAIRQIEMYNNAATASPAQLIRPSNTPVATTSQLGVAEDGASGVPASTVNADTGWSTAPTVGTNPMNKGALPATLGAGLIWTFDRYNGVIIPVSSYIVVWNYGASAGGVLNCTVVWEE